MPSDEAREIDVRELIGIIFRNRLIPLYATVVAFAAALLFLYAKTPVYRSGSVLAIEERRPFSGSAESILGKSAGKSDQRELLDKIRSRIKSRPFLLSLANDPVLNLDARIPSIPNQARRIASRTEMDANELRERLWVEFLRGRVGAEIAGRGLFFIFVQLEQDRELTHDLARVLARRFVESLRQGQLESIRATADFSEEQRKVYKGRLDESERKLKEFKAELLGGGDLDTGVLNEGNIATARDLQQQLERDAADLTEASDGKAKEIREKYGIDIDSIETDQDCRDYAKRLVKEQWELVLLKLAKSSPPEELKGQQSTVRWVTLQLRSSLEKATRDRWPEHWEEIHYALLDRAQAKAIGTAAEKLGGMLRRYTETAKLRGERESELKRLEDEVARNRSLMKMFEEQITSNRIAEAVEIEKGVGTLIEEIEPAAEPIKPLTPNPRKAFLLAALAGPLIGLGFVLMLEYADSSIRKVEEIEEDFGVPVLGTIPKLDELNKTGFWKRHSTAILTILALIILVGIVAWVMMYPPASLAG